MHPTTSAGSPAVAVLARWWRAWITMNRRQGVASAPRRLQPNRELREGITLGGLTMMKTASAAIALLALANPALAAGCATPNEAAALKTAVIQQELMVAALQCRETTAYNRFVMTYRGELQTSDATLKTFFLRRGGEHGEAGYDTFKTKAANLSALEQARNSRAFCAD